MTLFSWFRKARINTCSGITARTGVSDQLLTQIITDENLEQAFDWLCQQNPTQDHSDVWAYRRDWAQHKTALQQRINAGRFSFQAAREVDITDEQGHISRREIRPAEDRLLIRAIAQVLKPVFGEALSKDCVHLSGNGGLKATVAQVEDHISQHPNHQVIKSDIKGYYANINHSVLNEQFQHLLPNEPLLHILLWDFMRRTVAFGGNYREIECGLPLGASLSPLLAALYLSPPDELAKTIPDTFYRRYMDDWVWVLPKKHPLRKAMKKQYSILQMLRIAMHPDKTFIGKVNKGFDFIGFHLTPTGVTVSDTSLSRHEHKVARLYEQSKSGASKKRIRAYRLRWLVWVIFIVSPGLLYAAPPGGAPEVSNNCRASGHTFRWFFISGGANRLDNRALDSTSPYGSTLRNTANAYAFRSFYTTQPTALTSYPTTTHTTDEPSLAIGDSATLFLMLGASIEGYCVYQYTLTNTASGYTRTNASVDTPSAPPTSIPAYGPFAYVASFLGLLWFARRRKRR